MICLDVLRTMARQPQSVTAFFDEVAGVRGAGGRLDAAVTDLQAELADLDALECRARRVVEKMPEFRPGRVPPGP